ncbi:Hypothetical protein D9617_1g080520 [Elsinoe fawcettii]|nr:Hypothetical protein D9617_1g080520 [Elsinoe fawcettii]
MKTLSISAVFIACLLSGALAAPTKKPPSTIPSSTTSSSQPPQQSTSQSTMPPTTPPQTTTPKPGNNPSANVTPVNQQAGGIFKDPESPTERKPGDELPKIGPNNPALPQGDESSKVPKEDPKNNPSANVPPPNTQAMETYRPANQSPQGTPGVAPLRLEDDPQTKQPVSGGGMPAADDKGTVSKPVVNPAEAVAPSNMAQKDTHGAADEQKLSGEGNHAIGAAGGAIGWDSTPGMPAAGAAGPMLDKVGVAQLAQAKQDSTRGGEKQPTGTAQKDELSPAPIASTLGDSSKPTEEDWKTGAETDPTQSDPKTATRPTVQVPSSGTSSTTPPGSPGRLSPGGLSPSAEVGDRP